MKYVLLVFTLIASINMAAQEYQYTCTFFTNSPMTGDYFFSRTSGTGKSYISNLNGKLPVSELFFHTPGNALQLQYQNAGGGKWQAAVYRSEKRGMEFFKTAAFLSCWIFNTSATDDKELPLVQLMKADSSLTEAFPVKAPINHWQRLLIPVTAIEKFNPAKPEEIIGIVFSQQGNTNGIQQTIYVDDIEFVTSEKPAAITGTPVITSAKGYAKHIDITWKKISDSNIHFVKIYRSLDGAAYQAAGIQQAYTNRYADYTGQTGKRYFYKIAFLNNNYEETKPSLPVAAATKKMTDEELLSMVQEASFRYYWEADEKISGLAKENFPGRQNMIAAGAAGFGILALIVGTERKFITRMQSVDRFIQIVNFLEKAETFHGAYPHFIDGPTGKVEPFFGSKDNGADLVETSFLMEGLLTARQYFSGNQPKEKMIRDKITAIWKKIEWDWFKQNPSSKFLYWHWSPDQAWVINHTLIGWNETMVTYLLAIASPTHSVAAGMYYSGWANQDSTGRQYRQGWGQTTDGAMYSNGKTYYGVKLDVGVSNGGPLFFTHYSFMGYNPHAITDKYTNYFINNKNIATINYRYCVENPNHFKGYGDSAWGLTASLGPNYYFPDEPVPSRDNSKITPTGAIGSFPYLPKEAMKALKNYYFNYGKFLWGEYGFKDAFDLTNNWCSEIYMGLNQAPMTVMIENYRTGLIWKLFMSSPEIIKGLQKLELEKIK